MTLMMVRKIEELNVEFVTTDGGEIEKQVNKKQDIVVPSGKHLYVDDKKQLNRCDI